MVNTSYSAGEILSMLSVISDPEIPVLSIRDIGMLQGVNIVGDGCEVVITPTYTGCPAMGIIEADIRAVLESHGIHPVTVKTVLSPAWTTDAITAEAKEKIRNYGIAPPVASTCGNVRNAESKIACPHCSSSDTQVVSRFGATACKALYKCSACKEPFEYFKCH